MKFLFIVNRSFICTYFKCLLILPLLNFYITNVIFFEQMKSHLVEMLNKSITIIMYYVLLLLLSLLNRSKNKLAGENAMTRAIQRGSIFYFENLPWSNPCHTPPTFNGVAPHLPPLLLPTSLKNLVGPNGFSLRE